MSSTRGPLHAPKQNRTRVPIRWCPAHPDEQMKRGTRRCRRCTTDRQLPVRRRLAVRPDLLVPPHRPRDGTQRSHRRFVKGYAS